MLNIVHVLRWTGWTSWCNSTSNLLQLKTEVFLCRKSVHIDTFLCLQKFQIYRYVLCLRILMRIDTFLSTEFNMHQHVLIFTRMQHVSVCSYRIFRKYYLLLACHRPPSSHAWYGRVRRYYSHSETWGHNGRKPHRSMQGMVQTQPHLLDTGQL
jgi:hypothetical protein